MSAISHFQRGAFALIFAVSACGDDNPARVECGTGTMLVDGECVTDATCGSGTVLTNGMCVPEGPTTSYRQIEHLARPGIAEALIITHAYLAGYNATAPSFAGAPAAAVDAITAEAKTVLKAIYLGSCLLNGLVGFTNPADGVKPAGLQCVAVGGNIFTNDNALTGTTLDPAVIDGAQAYADRVFSQFETDVMRIDTGVTSAYLTLCTAGAPSNAPLLCGGRTLTDDVIDITYFYLIAGAALPNGANTAPTIAQSVALVSDGVYFSPDPAEVQGELGTPDPTNPNQFHQSCDNCGPQEISGTFPYSAPPR